MPSSDGSAALPVIDVGPLIGPASAAARAGVAGQIQAACRERGFFYVTGHGVPAGLLDELADASAEFFALPLADKLEIAMERGGRAWRGFFPVGAELTSGRPDLKEGLYFGAELPADDPRVLAGVPLHGGNLFPRQVPRLRPLVLAYLEALTSLGQAVLAGVAPPPRCPVRLAGGRRRRPGAGHPAAASLRAFASGLPRPHRAALIRATPNDSRHALEAVWHLVEPLAVQLLVGS